MASKPKRRRDKSPRSVKKRKRRRSRPGGPQATQQETTADERVLVHPREWFAREVAEDLWIPEEPLQVVTKPNFQRGGPHTERPRVPADQRLVEPLLTSWFDVSNYIDHCRSIPWRTERMPTPSLHDEQQPSTETHELPEHQRSVGELNEEDLCQDSTGKLFNSCIKLRLYPTTYQRTKLDQMFASNRAVYNMLVARSREDCADRLAQQDRANRTKLMTIREPGQKYRLIATAQTMARFFRKKKTLQRHLEVNDDVRDSAFRDFLTAVKSSRSLFFAQRQQNKPATFPELRFKSKFARSNSIEVRSKSIKFVRKNGKDLMRMHPTYFGFGKQDGIEIREPPPELTSSIRLLRLREGEYYIAVPRYVQYQPLMATRVCSIDPGVRQFATIYDPDGRTLSVKDAYSVLKRRFDAIDEMKAKLALMDNASKAKHKVKTRQRKKIKGNAQTKLHRQRHRLRRRIRCTYRHVTWMVRDLHKLSSWLANNYDQVLLPTFQTADMARKYEKKAAADVAPATSSDEVPQSPVRGQTQKQRKITGSTARAMMALSHYKFKELLRYKLERVGGRLIECGEEYTSKTCSSCGEIKGNLGGCRIYSCSGCHAVLDRDVNAAKNIFHKNMRMLYNARPCQSAMPSSRSPVSTADVTGPRVTLPRGAH